MKVNIGKFCNDIHTKDITERQGKLISTIVILFSPKNFPRNPWM